MKFLKLWASKMLCALILGASVGGYFWLFETVVRFSSQFGVDAVTAAIFIMLALPITLVSAIINYDF